MKVLRGRPSLKVLRSRPSLKVLRGKPSVKVLRDRPSPDSRLGWVIMLPRWPNACHLGPM